MSQQHRTRDGIKVPKCMSRPRRPPESARGSLLPGERERF
jgi:hypothetical protein